MVDERFNGVRYRSPAEGGHVESYFLKLNDPEGQRALWVKATILKKQGSAPAVAEAWAVAFDRGKPAVGVKQVMPLGEARFSPDGFDLQVGHVRFRDGRIEGEVESGRHRISYALDFTTQSAPLIPFPSVRMYQGKLPSSKLVSPYPDARFTGHYTVDDETVEVVGWKGMQGHNWGLRHAQLYGWVHCNQWVDDEDLMLEGVTARVKVGPVVAPPLTLVCVWHRGVRYELNDPATLLRAKGHVTHRSWSFESRSKLLKVEGEFFAETGDFGGLYYENPDGAMTYCLNSKIARGRVRLEFAGRPPLEVTTRSAALEVGTRDPSHGVQMLV